MKNPGMLVETKTGKKGRTYNSKGLINGKIPVYLELNKKPAINIGTIQYSDQAILCDPKTLKLIGYID